MAFDVYSPCPGGTGKNIKFCCPDMVGELEKINRMIEGEQYRAGLAHVNRLAEKQPTRPCLLATKALLLRVTGQMEEAQAVAAEFLRLQPDNPVALAESAILTAITEGGKAAMALCQRAMGASGKELSGRAYAMLGMVAEALLAEGEVLAGRAVLSIQAAANPQDHAPMELLLRLNAAPGIPLWAKDQQRLAECPPEAPWRAEFEAALALCHSVQWTAAADQLLALAGQIGDQPAIWRNIALLRAWSADRPACIEALRKVAALDVPPDDAVDAEALALYLADDPLGDEVDLFDLDYAVTDAEELEVLLASSPRVTRLAIDTSAMADEDEPPPKAVYALADRPMPHSAEGLTLEAIPRNLCQAALYGRQTDREARLEVIAVSAADLPQVKQLLAEAAGRALGAVTREEVAERVSATRAMLDYRWRLPPGTTPEQVRALVEEHERRVLLDQWPRLALGLFDGKSAEEAAGQEGCRLRLLGVVTLLEFWAGSRGVGFDFNRLRERLGLPLPEPIDPALFGTDRVPVSRLARVMVEKLSDEALVRHYYRALSAGATAAVRKLARAVIDRPSLAGREECSRAFRDLAQLAPDTDEALDYVDRGRAADEAAGRSSAPWDLMELHYRFQRLEGEHIGRLLNHLHSAHGREPGVAEAVNQMLMQYGLIGPDGRPVAHVPAPPPQPEIVVPGPASPTGGELWTPGGGSAPAGEKPKLWVPGMD
jgi:hypothetical protein